MKKRILSILLISALTCCMAVTAMPAAATTVQEDIMMNDFENWKPDFTTIRTGGDFWQLKRNTDKKYLTSGKYSLEIIAGGYYENSRPTVYFPMTSAMYGFNYDISKFTNVTVKVYNAKDEVENMRIGITTKSVGKCMPTEYELQPGWNSLTYTFNHSLIMMYNGTLEDIPKLYFEFDPAMSENFEDSAHVYVDDIKLIGAKADIEIVDVVKLDPYEICDFERAYQQYVVNWYVYQDTPPTATIVSNKDLPEGMTASHGTRCLKIETHPRADGWQAYPRFILTRFVVQKAINALTEEEKARAYVCFDICSPYYPWTFETGFRDTVTGALTNLVYETTSFWGPNVPKSKQWTTVKYSLAEIDAEKSYSIGRSPAGGSDFTNNPESILLNWADYFGGENRVFYLDNFRIELE